MNRNVPHMGKQMDITVKDKIIGEEHSVFIVAEMAWSHDGSVDKAKKIIKGAADAGADAISVHITCMEDYMVHGYKCLAGQTLSAGNEDVSIYNYLDKINLTDSAWKEIFPYARKHKIIICAMCNDIKSFEFCRDELKPEIYVISSACCLEYDLIREIAKEMKPVILRIGGLTLGEIEKVISLIKNEGNNEIILLHGIQMYPTKLEDTNLRLMDSLKRIFSLQVGLADHVDGSSELALIIPLISIPLGATVIEKHITYDRNEKGEDFEAALDLSNFKKFVDYVREIEKSMGSASFQQLSKAEVKYREVGTKRTVAKEDIQKNERITKEKITFKRSDYGVQPDESRYILGRTVKVKIRKNEPITEDKLV